MVANFGLDAIIKYSLPVLQILYPITIVTVVLIVINKFLPLSKRNAINDFYRLAYRFFPNARRTVFSHINDELNSSPAVRTNVAAPVCSGRDCCRYHAPFV